jgi:hypothetical protein
MKEANMDPDEKVPPATIIGTKAELQLLINEWSAVAIDDLAGIEAPRIYGSAALDAYPDAFRVASVRHGANMGRLLVDQINTLAAERGWSTIFAEPGYYLEPC